MDNDAQWRLERFWCHGNLLNEAKLKNEMSAAEKRELSRSIFLLKSMKTPKKERIDEKIK